MKNKNGIILFLLIVICVVAALLNKNFLSWPNLQNLGNLIALYGIFSLGIGVVIISGGIDLSVGSMMVLLGVLLCDMISLWGWPWTLAVAVIIGIGILLGALHGMLITRYRMQPFVVTLCGLLIYRGLARFISGDSTQSLGNSTAANALNQFVHSSTGGIPTTTIILVVALLVLWLVMHRSVYGRHLFALGRNINATRFAGIRINRITTIAYMISGGLAGLAAILITVHNHTVTPSTDFRFYEFYGIAAVVLGGCSLRGGEGSVIGMLIGVAIIQILQNIVNLLGLPGALNYTMIGAVILLAILADQKIKLGVARKPGPAPTAGG